MHNKQPFFSIIIPVYNIENYIGGCLSSLEKQTCQDFELILVDDGSTDNSGSICDHYATNTEYCNVVHTVNCGVSSARNIGLTKAMGKYILFIDGDDYVSENYVQVFYDILNKNSKLDLAVCGVCINDKNIVLNNSQKKNGLMERTEVIDELVKRNSIRGFLVNKAFKRDILSQNNISFEKNVFMCEDLLFCVNYVRNIEKAYFINMPLYNYIQRDGSACRTKFNPKRISVLQAYEEIQKIIDIYGSEKAKLRATINMLLHHVNIYLMICKHKDYDVVVEKSKKYITQNIRLIFNREIEMKSRIKAVIAYMDILFFRNKKMR